MQVLQEDTHTLQALVDTLVEQRARNAVAKQQIWTQLEQLEQLNKGDGHGDGDDDDVVSSLLYSGTNEQLSAELVRARVHNEALRDTLVEHQEALRSVANALVAANAEQHSTTVAAIAQGEQVVDSAADEMWAAWHALAGVVDEVVQLDQGVVAALEAAL
jgi:chromosome segregation ATPase